MRGTVGVAGGGQRPAFRCHQAKDRIGIQPVLPLDPQIHVPRPGRPDVDLTVARISADNGWLTIWAN